MSARLPQISTESRFPWPLITLDFEASALGAGSYPIEVGLAIWKTPDAPIQVWSTLIRPTSSWIEAGAWDAESQLVHKIMPRELADGASPSDVLHRLNDLIGANSAWCDGGCHDLSWLEALEAAAGIRASFKLGDWDMLTTSFDLPAVERMFAWLDITEICHRAADDAERLLRAIAVGLGRPHDCPAVPITIE